MMTVDYVEFLAGNPMNMLLNSDAKCTKIVAYRTMLANINANVVSGLGKS